MNRRKVEKRRIRLKEKKPRGYEPRRYWLGRIEYGRRSRRSIDTTNVHEVSATCIP